MVTNICDEAIGALNADKTLDENLSLLNKAYGYGRLKPLNQNKNTLDNVDFPVNKDPNQIFIWLDRQFSILEACGGRTDEIFLRQVFETGLESSRSANEVFEVGDFWFIVRGQLNSLKQFNLENVKNMTYT